MAPGQYTHLFFLDEATALAAGHRPCGECRRADYVRFKTLWAELLGLDASTLKAGDMDHVLHAERVRAKGNLRHQPTYKTIFDSIPNGVMFHLGHADAGALLKWAGRAWVWTPEGYRPGPLLNQPQPIEILTPKTIVDVIRAGYVPRVHWTVENKSEQ